MIKALVAIAVVCLVIAILPPIAVYLHFNDVIESYQLQISDLQQENEQLKGLYSKQAYLVTELGWYLHGSTDPIPTSRNKLTIYGPVYNIGTAIATNCKLMVNFYNSRTLLQSSEIQIGAILNSSSRYVHRVIDCELADSVTRIEVERTWTDMP